MARHKPKLSPLDSINEAVADLANLQRQTEDFAGRFKAARSRVEAEKADFREAAYQLRVRLPNRPQWSVILSAFRSAIDKTGAQIEYHERTGEIQPLDAACMKSLVAMVSSAGDPVRLESSVVGIAGLSDHIHETLRRVAEEARLNLFYVLVGSAIREASEAFQETKEEAWAKFNEALKANLLVDDEDGFSGNLFGLLRSKDSGLHPVGQPVEESAEAEPPSDAQAAASHCAEKTIAEPSDREANSLPDLTLLEQLEAEVSKLPNAERRKVVNAVINAHPKRLRMGDLIRGSCADATNIFTDLATNHPFFSQVLDLPGGVWGRGYGLKNMPNNRLR